MVDLIKELIEAFTKDADIAHIVLAAGCLYFGWQNQKLQSDKYELAIKQVEASAETKTALNSVVTAIDMLAARVKT